MFSVYNSYSEKVNKNIKLYLTSMWLKTIDAFICVLFFKWKLSWLFHDVSIPLVPIPQW